MAEGPGEQDPLISQQASTGKANIMSPYELHIGSALLRLHSADAGGGTEAEGSTPDDLVAWFQTTIQDYDATFIIYYRGVW